MLPQKRAGARGNQPKCLSNVSNAALVTWLSGLKQQKVGKKIKGATIYIDKQGLIYV